MILIKLLRSFLLHNLILLITIPIIVIGVYFGNSLQIQIGEALAGIVFVLSHFSLNIPTSFSVDANQLVLAVLNFLLITNLILFMIKKISFTKKLFRSINLNPFIKLYFIAVGIIIYIVFLQIGLFSATAVSVVYILYSLLIQKLYSYLNLSFNETDKIIN